MGVVEFLLVEMLTPVLSDGDFHAVDAATGGLTALELCAVEPGPFGPRLVLL